MCCRGGPGAAGDKDSSQEDTVIDVATMQQGESDTAAAYAAVAGGVFYNRTSGWSGKTYEEAITFCSSKENTPQLCPYESYCPLGERKLPYGGGIGEDELEDCPDGKSWAPISDAHNDWVQIGRDGEGMCLTYMNMNLMEPVWGLTGEDSYGFTGYLMCCPKDGADGINEGESDSDKVASNTTVAPQTPQTDATDKEDDEIEHSPSFDYVRENFKPTWYSRGEGWTGQTYNEATDFCSSTPRDDGQKQMLCPFAAYCPMGPQNKPFGGFREETSGISWSPVANDENWWVQTGVAEGPCMFYNVLHEGPPDWGLSGNDNEGITRHVLCCDESEVLHTIGGIGGHGSVDETEPAAAPAQPAPKPTPPLTITDSYGADAENFEPIW